MVRSLLCLLTKTPLLKKQGEPTGNLDPETSWEIMNIFEEINNRGTTLVMATHNRDIVNNIKRRVIAIEEMNLNEPHND